MNGGHRHCPCLVKGEKKKDKLENIFFFTIRPLPCLDVVYQRMTRLKTSSTIEGKVSQEYKAKSITS